VPWCSTPSPKCSVMQDPEAAASARISAAKAMLETAVKGIGMEGLAARMRPSKRKDSSDMPAAVVGPYDPAGSPAAPVDGGRCAAARVGECEPVRGAIIMD
jgi:hypothetical protein